MEDLLPILDAWAAEGVRAGRAVVIRSFGSAPRPVGAVLAATEDGRIAGSVSGGCVEGAAVGEIERARADGTVRTIRYGISDETARSVGLACGGTIDVLVEPRIRPELIAAARERGQVVAIPLPPGGPGADPGPALPGEGPADQPAVVLDEMGGRTGTTGDPEADALLAAAAADALATGRPAVVPLAGREWLLEVAPRPPRLVIVGAVQVAIPLVALARTLGWRTVVVDGRPAFATRERFPHADELIVGWPDEAAEAIGLGPADSVAVLSHDVKFDEPAIALALARGCRYVGAVGSRRTQADRRERLRAAGVSEEGIARLHGPIGLDLGGREPAETALAILAEIVAARFGGSGLPLALRAAEAGAGGPLR